MSAQPPCPSGAATASDIHAHLPPRIIGEFDLKGMERFFTMNDTTSAKCAHVMLIEGTGVHTLLTNLPMALMRTINQHPRMRILQSENGMKARVLAPFENVEDVLSHLHIQEIHQLTTSANEPEPEVSAEVVVSDTDKKKIQIIREEWHCFVENECEKPFDRFVRMPFEVFVWKYSENKIRLFLFTDHYMSDGMSGMIFLHTLLTESTITKKEVLIPSPLIKDSLYSLWIESTLSCRLRFIQRCFKLFKNVCFQKLQTKMLTPFLNVNTKQQQDFQLPNPIKNPSKALFTSGTKQNLQDCINKCRLEKTTIGAAMSAAIVVAFLRTKQLNDKKHISDQEQVHLRLEVDVDMRRRLPTDQDLQETIGCYMISDVLEEMATKGISINMSFWELARKLKHEMDTMISNRDEMKIPQLFIHENLHRFQRKLKNTLKSSVATDANMSNIGPYPYEFNYPNDLQVKNVHVYNSMPHFTSCTMFFLTSVEQFDYVLMHKLDEPLGQKLFEEFVSIMEKSGHISSVLSVQDLLTDEFN